MNSKSPIAVILGSAFSSLVSVTTEQVEIDTPYGIQKLFVNKDHNRESYLIVRHGLPHSLLPNQINYRAQAHALKQIGCKALLVTSSVGILTTDIPLFTPMLLSDLLMIDNRLPDGSTCTMFDSVSPDQGHLVLREGLFSSELNKQIVSMSGNDLWTNDKDIVFGYAGGPRSKTTAENKLFHLIGAQVNSMTLAPEIVLANELEIPCSGLVVGHKYSLATKTKASEFNVSDSLVNSRNAMESIIVKFLNSAQGVSFKNDIYRYPSAKE